MRSHVGKVTKHNHVLLFALLGVLLGQTLIHAQTGPRLPCGGDTMPAYPSLDDVAVVKAWSKSELGDNWKPPECTGWTSAGFTTLVTIVARFHYGGEAQDLLHHIGAISQLKGLRYWSITHKEWQTLIVNAYALTGDKSLRGRRDFELNEMTSGSILYYEQFDNRSGKAVYRIHMLETSSDRLVIEIENVSTIHYLLVPLFRPTEIQSIYFLDRESQGVWRYYSIARTAKSASRILAGNESSAVNRTVAFYRYMVGIPTDQEPPAAR